ncbi:unnamed protein product [Caenorhabditis sp. 36 PRJEB53466]|nr:unnamed protein product [Caenorhabditis sp. 36 PRJEB53466]
MKVIGINGAETVKSNRVRLQFKGEKDLVWTTEISTHPEIPIIFRAPVFSSKDIKHLKRKRINPYSIMGMRTENGDRIDLILGASFIAKLAPEAKRHVLPSGRIVEETKLGIITHPTPSNEFRLSSERGLEVETNEYYNSVVVNTLEVVEYRQVSEAQIFEGISRLFQLEHVGIQPQELAEKGRESDETLLEKFRESATMVDGKIQVALPFNGREADLTDNFPVCILRLSSLLTVLQKDKRTLWEYDLVIKTQLAEGIIEVVPESELHAEGLHYYMPHRHVMKEESCTTKLRIVLDASSRMRGRLSLNDCLHAGPSLLLPILGILMRARCSKYLLIADIAKAFHQVPLRPEFRNVVKFLWVKDPEGSPNHENLVVYRFTKLPFGASSSPFILAATILLYLEMNPHEINERIKSNLYVDNVVLTTNEESELPELYSGSKKAFNNMSMNLREYMTNSKGTMEKVPVVDRAQSEVNKLLGHVWDSVNDTITIKIPKPPTGHPTKRQMASFLASNYDPQGLLSPIIVPVKEVIQKLWEKEVKWKQRIPKQLLKEWEVIKESFTQTSYTLPRQLVVHYDYESVQLLVFSDASERHFATAVYAHFRYKDREPVTKLVMSKSKVKPKNVSLSIPRLELMGMEIASHASLTAYKELKMEKLKGVKFFSDSMIALYWVLKKEKLTKFAHNRVEKIHQNTLWLKGKGFDPSFHHCPTEYNPADLASRGVVMEKLFNNSLWFDGPEFLKNPESEWPIRLEGKISYPQEFRELIFERGGPE